MTAIRTRHQREQKGFLENGPVMESKRLLNSNRWRTATSLSVLLQFFLFGSLQAQEILPPLSERVTMASDQILVVNDLEVVKTDIEALFQDLSLGSEDGLDDWFQPDIDVGISRQAGCVVYWKNSFVSPVREFRVVDREKLHSVFDLPQPNVKVEDKTWTSLKEESGVPLFDSWTGNQTGTATIVGNRFITASSRMEDLGKLVCEGKPLAPLLNPIGHGIINSSGLTFIALGDNVDPESIGGFDRILTEASGDITEAESEWLQQLAVAANSAKAALMGVKYHKEKVIELRGQAVLDKKVSLGKLFKLAHSDERWDSDLGFDPKGLVMTAAVKLDAFKSSAGPRAAAHVLLQEGGVFQQSEFLRGNMLKLMIELVGDSWNDLTAARIGVYQNDKPDKVGQLALVSVVDSRDPAIVMDELAKISRLTNPGDTEEQNNARQAEVKRLIAELESDDANVSARAETRLRLTGEIGMEELSQAKSQLSENAQRRADRVLRRIKYRLEEIDELKVEVLDPEFWTTLNPGLELKPNSGTLAGFPVHSILVTPDAAKSPEEVTSAVEIMTTMFGPKWDEIKVVQVDQHFVFMVGSNEEALSRTINNVKAGSSLLMTHLEKTGYGSKTGQLQGFVNTFRLQKVFSNRGFRKAIKETHDDKLCWLGIQFSERAIGVEALVPIEQIGAVFLW
jgi:hypothetical protein